MVGVWVLFCALLSISNDVFRFATIWSLIFVLAYVSRTVDVLRKQQGIPSDSYRLTKIRRLFSLRNGFYLISVLNLVDILQTIPFFPRFEANPFVKQYPYVFFTCKILIFVIIVPWIFPKVIKYWTDSEELVGKILKFPLYYLVTVGNLTFIYVVISNTIAIIEILKIL